MTQHHLRRRFPNLEVLPSNYQIRGMHTILRDRTTNKNDVRGLGFGGGRFAGGRAARRAAATQGGAALGRACMRLGRRGRAWERQAPCRESALHRQAVGPAARHRPRSKPAPGRGALAGPEPPDSPGDQPLARHPDAPR